jgi:hypothetical protein
MWLSASSSGPRRTRNKLYRLANFHTNPRDGEATYMEPSGPKEMRCGPPLAIPPPSSGGLNDSTTFPWRSIRLTLFVRASAIQRSPPGEMARP